MFSSLSSGLLSNCPVKFECKVDATPLLTHEAMACRGAFSAYLTISLPLPEMVPGCKSIRSSSEI